MRVTLSKIEIVTCGWRVVQVAAGKGMPARTYAEEKPRSLADRSHAFVLPEIGSCRQGEDGISDGGICFSFFSDSAVDEEEIDATGNDALSSCFCTRRILASRLTI